MNSYLFQTITLIFLGCCRVFFFRHPNLGPEEEYIFLGGGEMSDVVSEWVFVILGARTKGVSGNPEGGG